MRVQLLLPLAIHRILIITPIKDRTAEKEPCDPEHDRKHEGKGVVEMKKQITPLSKELQLKSSLPKRSKIIADIDKIVGDIVKYRDNFTCKRCGTPFKPFKRNPDGKCLQASHYTGRSHFATRWLFENLDAMCSIMVYSSGGWIMSGCHGHLEREKNGEYRRIKIAQLGIAGVERLEALATTTASYNTAELLALKQHFKKILDEAKKNYERGIPYDQKR